MFKVILSISFIFTILCQYYSFHFNHLLKENDKEILSIKESIKMNSKTNEITTSILYNDTNTNQSDICYSTLVYPEYAHSTQCYPHLYLLIYI